MMNISVSRGVLRMTGKGARFPRVRCRYYTVRSISFPRRDFSMVLDSLTFRCMTSCRGLVGGVCEVLGTNNGLIFAIRRPIFATRKARS